MRQMRTSFVFLGVTLAVGLFVDGALAAAIVYSEDFRTDPFASRWTTTSTGGYPLYWTGDNPSSINGQLPAEAGNPLDALYAFSSDNKHAWTTDVTEQTTSYTVTMDFMINGSASVSDDVFGMYLQRQDDDTGYVASFAPGGNGQVSWSGCYGWTGYDGEAIVANVWYRFVTEVAISAGDVQLQSKIVRISDGHVMRTSPVFTDSSADRLTSAKGYGIGYTSVCPAPIIGTRPCRSTILP